MGDVDRMKSMPTFITHLLVSAFIFFSFLTIVEI